MTIVSHDLALAVLLVILALAAYVDRIYSEMGKFLAREYQDNIDAWTRTVEPRLRLGRVTPVVTGISEQSAEAERNMKPRVPVVGAGFQ